MLFFYRLLFFSYLVNRIIALVPSLILIVVYLFLVGVMLIGLSNNSLFSLDSAMYAIHHPGETFKYLYRYLKWLWYNKETISLEHFIECISAFSFPYIILRFSKKSLIWLMKNLKALIVIYGKKLLIVIKVYSKKLSQKLKPNKDQ